MMNIRLTKNASRPQKMIACNFINNPKPPLFKERDIADSSPPAENVKTIACKKREDSLSSACLLLADKFIG